MVVKFNNLNMTTKLEINFGRLLTQCEVMAAGKNKNDWRLEKYIEALETQLSDLRKSPSCPPNDVTNEYGRRVEFLKGLLQTEKLPTAAEKAMANQLLSPTPVSTNEKLTKEIHLQTAARYSKEMRRELLDDLGTSQDGLRLRKQESVTEDLDSILQYHNDLQQRMAEEMIALAKNMKENSLIAREIVKGDIETLDKSSKLADQNYSKLKIESERLEVHTQKACNWWIWLMLFIVCATFIWMIIFMKLFPKH